MCGCECCISAKSMNFSMSTLRDIRLKHLKDIIHNAQNRRPGEISSRIFETYNNAVRTHGFHIYNTAADMAMSNMCPCNYKHHGLPHWKCVLMCCNKCPSIVLTSQEAIEDTTNTCPTIRFHVYRNVLNFTLHG